jgi:hypothetical protein
MKTDVLSNTVERTSEAHSMETSSALEQVIARAVADVEFRKLLFENPAAAVAEYNLKAADLAALDLLTPDMLKRTGDIALLVGSNC